MKLENMRETRSRGRVNLDGLALGSKARWDKERALRAGLGRKIN